MALRKRLDEMLGHMKERIGGKIGNQNNNAFKLRKLFAMADTAKTGLVRALQQPNPAAQTAGVPGIQDMHAQLRLHSLR